ncbi:MAG: glutathione S-transferase [Pseudomonadota bacterium]
MADTLPTLYSFRRCPYAMRGRMALLLSGQKVLLRELILQDKPAHMLEVSPKGTVPVLILPNGKVIDESLDIMYWALEHHDPENLLSDGEEASAMAALIAENDGPFKHHLDRYKYETRYEEENVDAKEHQAIGLKFLQRLNDQLKDKGQLFSSSPKFADYAIFPFVRQFRIANMDWFDAQELPALHQWLHGHMESPVFQTAMQKFPLWNETGEEFLFAMPAHCSS